VTVPSKADVAIRALIAEERLPESYAAIVADYWAPLADRIAARHAAAGRSIVIGINGAQGSGKSTLCRFLEGALLPAHGLRAATLSLDDLYLTYAERQAFARDVHPLFATRGVPGTHDVALGLATLDALALPGTARLPWFDKSTDDRGGFRDAVQTPVDVILFEGWCIGAEPQDEAMLADPINRLEAEEDPDGRWRRAANTALIGDYAALFGRLDELVMLRPPGFELVLANRLLQERKLRERSPAGARVMDDAAVARFVEHYERITRHMLATMPDRADVVIDIDDRQQVTGMRAR